MNDELIAKVLLQIFAILSNDFGRDFDLSYNIKDNLVSFTVEILDSENDIIDM